MQLTQIAVLYASQTGNTEFIANQIKDLVISKGYKASSNELNDYAKKVSFNHETLYIFVHATTGDGDAPDNATKFWRFLRKASKEQLLIFKNLNYALIGFGDSTYEQFNRPAKLLDSMFMDMGALKIQESLFNDDSLQRDSDVIAWIDSLVVILPTLVEKNIKVKSTAVDKIQFQAHSDLAESILLETRNLSLNTDTKPYIFEIYSQEYESIKQLTGVSKYAPSSRILTPSISTKQNERTDCYPFETNQIMNWETTSNTPYLSTILSSKTLTGSKAIERVIQVELDVGREWEWESGDAIGIISPNNNLLVLSMCHRLGVLPDSQYTCDSKLMSFYETLKWTLDLQSFPKKAFFRCMAEFADDSDKRKLLYLVSIQGAKTFKRLREERISIIDILHSFPSVLIPFVVLLDNLLKLQPRYYSIASSNLRSKSAICIAFGIVDYTFLDRSFNGLCSGYMDSIVNRPSAQIAIFPKPRSGLMLSKRENVIMICAGTGITPFMGLIEDSRLRIEMKTHDESKKRSKMWLFYGCRFKGTEGDILYPNELEHAKETGVLQELSVAYSRDDKQYVQDKMKIYRDEILEWMNDGASIYVCGGLAMSKDVSTTLLEIFEDDGRKGIEFVQRLIDDKRYTREIWG